MTQTVSDFILERLRLWNVDRIYGYPGDGINGMLGALARAQDGPRLIQTRHEESAAMMACAHAKFTGEVGVCLATSGPGAIHLLNGLYDAKADHQPVLCLVGQQRRAALGGDYQQEVDLLSLFKDVAHEYVQMAVTPAQVRHLIDRAIRIARDQRTVTCVILPNDIQDMPAVAEPPAEHGTIHSGAGYVPPVVVPDSDSLDRAAAVLNAGSKVAMLVGAGALHATDEVMAVAERLGAGVAKALLGKAVVPDDVPYVTGALGLLGTKPSWDLMSECDTLLMVGSSFPYSEFLPAEGQARGVQIDLDGRKLSLRYPMEVPLVGDARATLAALLPRLQPRADRGWRDRVEQNVERWWRVLERRAMDDSVPINPQRAFWELSPRLPDGAIVCADSGTAANWYARDIRLRRGMMGSLSGGLASMGPALPYAIAAKFAYPQRVAFALEGDGAMQMNGINELITVAARWPEWSDPRLVVMVLNNGDLNQVTWEQRAMGGDPRFAVSQDVPAFDYAAYARMLGLEGIRVENPGDLGASLDRALAADRPVVLDVLTDRNVPPIPPHVPAKSVRNYLSALVSGDADARAVLRATAREMWAEIFPAPPR
ncbi:thiamine pyrophosphate-requiring protein [Cupriavidus respiraculi]|uniref:Thiamine pyrophosphate-containing protein YdaP n=1 Tax=Cupriavidus respiraculi TaxID=195930 RepID=A0ABN7Y525_9BURK|nr:thiamine pyrophosphate-requiring protein [Cupriavidus respiraculi]CAG9168485.1 Putative thiamine pyrophosphate-containing protein YdaP [Cupriavidus respiraculi]